MIQPLLTTISKAVQRVTEQSYSLFIKYCAVLLSAALQIVCFVSRLINVILKSLPREVAGFIPLLFPFKHVVQSLSLYFAKVGN